MRESNSPSVSVVIPTYNRAHTLGRAIGSVLCQVFQDFEIIVVDDGSTDGTRAIVNGFGDRRIRYAHHERNRGAAAARNTGIKLARGEFLAFLDSDDEWLPHKLGEQISLLKEPAADWGLTCSGFLVVVDGSEQEYVHAPFPSWGKRLHWGCDLGPGTTLVVRRECLAEVGLLDEEFPRCEDWDWLLRLSNRYPLALVEKPLARVYMGRLPAANVVESSLRRFVIKHDGDFRAVGWYYRQRVVSRHWLGLAYFLYRERQFLRGTQYLLTSFLNNPLQNPIEWIRVFLSGVRALVRTPVMPSPSQRKREVPGG